VPGERVVLVPDGGGRLLSFVEVLGALPAEPRWVVVGGFAVWLRIGRVHRVTADIDTVARDVNQLVEVLVAGGATPLSAARLTLPPLGVRLDVMSDTIDEPLPDNEGDRAFALARRFAAASAEDLSIEVISGAGEPLGGAKALVATVPGLIVMKAVSLPRRSASPHPEKVGSDIHDLVRLAAERRPGDIAAALRDAPAELVLAVGETLLKWFAADHDLRYTQARLRRLVSADDAAAVDGADLVLVGELGAVLLGSQ
jgi:Nucleotidyl transferase AbiEii toxin, Type IV TA system